MTRLAIVIRGISYCQNTQSCSATASVDYRRCLHSFRSNVLSQLKTLFDHIDFFLVTYYSDIEVFQQLLDDYKPRDTIIMPNKDIFIKREASYVNHLISTSLGLVEKYAKDYDHVLETRFDLFYYNKLDLSKIDLDKINIAWRSKDYGQCDDAFILTHIKHIPSMIAYYNTGQITHKLNSNENISRECVYISKDLDPVNGYHYPDFFIYQRDIERYKKGEMLLY
jgi:hypothetical protein